MHCVRRTKKKKKNNIRSNHYLVHSFYSQIAKPVRYMLQQSSLSGFIKLPLLRSRHLLHHRRPVTVYMSELCVLQLKWFVISHRAIERNLAHQHFLEIKLVQL